MKISAVNSQINFGRNLSPVEMKGYKSTLKEGKELAGQTGKSIFIMPTSCLPQTDTFNSGIGNISSDISQDYLKYMRDYTGFNIVEDLPAGQIPKAKDGFYCAYDSSAFALGNHQINPELLTTKEFGCILKPDEVKGISSSNTSALKDEIVNFRNVMDNDGAQNRVLKKAFSRFEKLDEQTPLRQRFEQYKKENDFWLSFKREGEESQEFFKFKQFLADEHLKIGKEKLNKEGIKLCGDCLIGFSEDEVKAFPKAFKKDSFIGMPEWGLPALNYEEVAKEGSEANKLLKAKVQTFARRYDMVRFDVAWAYVTPVVTPKGVNQVLEENKVHMGDSLLKSIEGWVKEVKGDKFDLKDLIYEFDAGGDDFRAFDNNGQLIAPLRNRTKIYGSTYMHEAPFNQWGFNEAFTNRGWSRDEFILGVGNHDPQPLKQIAKDIPEEIVLSDGSIMREAHKQEAINPLSRIFNIPREQLQDPAEFAKAKWAEPMMSKNNQMFYMDVFGREERFDMQGLNTICHPEKNYAYKVPADYKSAYMKGVSEGFGFNPMDSLEKVFRAKGLDKSHPELFERIVKYKQLLLDPEPAGADVVKSKAGKCAVMIAGGVLLAGAGIYLGLKGINKPKKNK